MKQLMHKLQDVKKKKGSMAIEIVTGCLIFLILLCVFLDLILIGWKFATVSQMNTKVARQAGIQGGVLASAPEAYPGGNASYTSISELNTTLKNSLKGSGIEDGEWELKIDGRKVLGGGTVTGSSEIEYGESFETELSFSYEWKNISNFIPGVVETTITTVRPTMSEWKYDYDSWIGE